MPTLTTILFAKLTGLRDPEYLLKVNLLNVFIKPNKNKLLSYKKQGKSYFSLSKIIQGSGFADPDPAGSGHCCGSGFLSEWE